MKHALLSFSLALAAIFAPNTPYRVDDVAMRTAITSTLNCISSTEIAVAQPISVRSMRWSWICPNGHRWSSLLLTPGVLYRHSIHRMRNPQQNRYCR